MFVSTLIMFLKLDLFFLPPKRKKDENPNFFRESEITMKQCVPAVFDVSECVSPVTRDAADL